MVDFSKILQRGRKRFEIKNRNNKWGRCENCDKRKILHQYTGNKNDAWLLCDNCINDIIKEEK